MKQIYLMITAGILLLVCIILSIDRFRLNTEFYSIGIRINEKTEEIRRNELDFSKKLEEKNREITLLDSRFQFVTELKKLPENPMKKPGNEIEKDKQKNRKLAEPLKQPLLPFAQYTLNKDDLKLVKSLVGQVPSPVTPENVKKTYQNNYLNMPQQTGRVYLTRTGIIDRDAAILEEVCRALQLKAGTVLHWDMERMQHFSITTISSPLPDDPPAVVYCQGRMDIAAGRTVIQSAPVSTILPLGEVSLPDGAERELLLKIHQLPVGGLYLHKIEVYQPAGSSAKEWLLEYKFPDEEKMKERRMPDLHIAQELDPFAGQNPAETAAAVLPAERPMTLQAVSLLPGKAVTSVWTKDRQTFRIPFCNGKSSVLILGNRTFLPETVSALPFPGSGK